MTLLPHLFRTFAEAREGADISKAELARAIGVNRSIVTRLEAGRISTWPAEIDRYVEGYAAAAGVAPAEIWRRAIAAMEDSSSSRG